MNSCNTIEDVATFFGIIPYEATDQGHCDLKCRNEILVVGYLTFSSIGGLKFFNKSFGSLQVTVNDQIQIIEEGQTSEWFLIDFLNNQKYKITSSKVGTIIEQEKFNFNGNMKDGTLLRDDAFLFHYLNGCNLINSESGKIEKLSCD